MRIGIVSFQNSREITKQLRRNLLLLLRRSKIDDHEIIGRYTPFPPENHIMPSKIDLQIESGEYFLSEKQKKERAATKKKEAAVLKATKKREEREKLFVPPKEKK